MNTIRADMGKSIGGENREDGFWTPTRILVALILFALLLRILATLTRSIIQFDETAYVRIAENLASGKGLLDISGLTTTHFTPLLPFMIAGLAYLTGDYVVAGYAVVTLFGALLLIPTYLLGREMAGVRVGLMAAALMAVSPIFVGTKEYIYTESIFTFFLLLSAFFFWQTLNRWRFSCASLSAISLGLAYLANPLAVFFVVVFPVLALSVSIRRKLVKRMLKVVALFLALFFLVASPYLIFLHSELGRWTLSGKESFAHNNYAATHNLQRDDVREWEGAITSLDESGEEIVALSIEKIGITEFFLNHPFYALKIFLKQTYDFYTEILYQLLPLWLLPLLGLGLFASGWDRRRALSMGYLVLLLSPVILILAMLAFARFFMPFIPIFMIWIGMGWQRLEHWGDETLYLSFGKERTGRLKRWVPRFAAVLVLLPIMILAAATTLSQDYPVELKEAGDWLRQEAGDGTRVINRDFSSAYYAGATAVLLPTADYRATTDYACSKDAQYMIIRSKDIDELRPGLAGLRDDPSAHPDWTLIKKIRPGTDQETLIYKLEAAGCDT